VSPQAQENRFSGPDVGSMSPPTGKNTNERCRCGVYKYFIYV